MEMTEAIYKLSTSFPTDERYGLTSQIRRAAVSIPSNIAEGRSRSSRKDFVQFLHISLGSVSEVETQLELAKRLSFCGESDYNKVVNVLLEVKKMLSKMISSLKAGS
ncbi:MAG: S23 ribosomal protein [Parcubacteria group bacterium GW2011_GWA2_56_21]|nr:MAG: S23 ribosomal protein [Parcubacteria group bacterium GW2011_GWA2_56_21]